MISNEGGGIGAFNHTMRSLRLGALLHLHWPTLGPSLSLMSHKQKPPFRLTGTGAKIEIILR